MEYELAEVGSVAEKVIVEARRRRASDHATLITLSGDLGAGKTTLVTEIAHQLGVTESLQSPTFVIYKKYALPHDCPWKYLIHGDMYRLESASEIEKLGWQELVSNPDHLICIEWPEQITGAIPDWAICVVIHHRGGEKRLIEI